MVAKVFSFLFLTVGVMVLFQVVWPLFSYKIWAINNLRPENLVSPQGYSASVLGVSIKNTDNGFPAFVSSLKREQPAPFEEFLITVTSLGIKDAKVYVDSNDLNKGLAHLPGSALPGERGNVFISGHSAISPFFKGNSNYGTIFARLTDLKKGDKIEVSAGGLKFNYQVLGFRAVEPSDLSVISAPDTTGRFISLMTCVPPGLNTKRLVVLGRLF